MRSADRAAGTMFNVFPQGVGERVSGGAQALAGMAMGAINRFSNPFGALASDIGAARQAVSGTRLVGPMTAFQVPPTPPTPVLPSGTPMTGFDIYPTATRSATSTTMAMAPQPAAPMLGASAPVPAFPTSGMGIMGNQNIRPLPTDQISPMGRMAPTLADRGGVTTDITGMQGKTPIQTPYGTVYATAGQAGTQRVAEMGGLPAQSARLENIGEQAQRSAAIAQMRERGAALAQQRFGAQESFFAQKRAEREALGTAETAARTAGVRPMDIMGARAAAAGPSTIGGIQREFASYQPTIGPMAPTSLYAANAESRFRGALPEGGSRPLPSGAMGASGYALAEQMQAARRALGATGPYSNAGAERRKRNRQGSQARGFQAPYSTGAQEAFEKYLRSQREEA
jgi:hypothetical protein